MTTERERGADDRSTEEVVGDHLAARDRGDLEADLAANYADDVVLLSADGATRGIDAVRTSAERLFDELGPSTFDYRAVVIEGAYGFLAWSAESDTRRIDDGADSYVVRGGRIVMQSVHYTVRTRDRANGGAA